MKTSIQAVLLILAVVGVIACAPAAYALSTYGTDITVFDGECS